MKLERMAVVESPWRVWFSGSVASGLPPSRRNPHIILGTYKGARLPIATAWDAMEFL